MIIDAGVTVNIRERYHMSRHQDNYHNLGIGPVLSIKHTTTPPPCGVYFYLSVAWVIQGRKRSRRFGLKSDHVH